MLVRSWAAHEQPSPALSTGSDIGHETNGGLPPSSGVVSTILCIQPRFTLRGGNGMSTAEVLTEAVGNPAEPESAGRAKTNGEPGLRLVDGRMMYSAAWIDFEPLQDP